MNPLAKMLVAALRRHDARVAGPDGSTWQSTNLLALAEATADSLAARAVQPAEPVHVTIGNRPEDLGVLLGVWLAGAVAVPVHRSAPAIAVRGLQQTSRAGRGVIMVTHNEATAEIADRVVRMRDGAIVATDRNSVPADAATIRW